MPSKQTLLFPDPRPLVDLLGSRFFRGLPTCPGVYLMRDACEAVLYVGKARNLRKRLNSYRVSNPERLPRRHLRLLRAVARIEWEKCADEAAALLRESSLIRELKPPFNRAGTWPATPCFIGWRLTDRGLQLGVFESLEPAWASHGPLGGAANHVYAALARVFWLGLNPGRTASELPTGWAHDELTPRVAIECAANQGIAALDMLERLVCGNVEALAAWMTARASTHSFDRAMIAEDLEVLNRRFQKHNKTMTAAQR